MATLQGILDSGLYRRHNIESANPVYFDHDTSRDPMGLSLWVRDLDGEYRRRLYIPIGRNFRADTIAILTFLCLDETQKIEDNLELLVGKEFLEPREDAPIERLGEYIGNSGHIRDGTKFARLSDVSYAKYYEPISSFEIFAQAKEFARRYDLVGEWKWGDIQGLDHDIAQVVHALNRVPFVYTTNWSDSGTPSDRVSKNPDTWKSKGKLFAKEMIEALRKSSSPEFIGYIHFIADTQDENYNNLS